MLSIFAVASLLVGLLVLGLWWRSYHHTDSIGFGNLSSRRADYTTRNGRVMVVISQNVEGQIITRADFYPISRVFGWCLIIPCFWLAIWVRGKLPRPGRARRDDYLPPLGSSRF